MRKRFVFTRLVFFFLVFFSLYLLVISRAGEIHTVWEFMNPLFMPVFFAVTLLLAWIVFSSEGIRFKLVFVMLYCFIGVSFYAAVFPAGTLGSQQSVLGITRLLYDNVVLHGWGGDVENVFLRVYNWLDKPNFQSVYTIVLARMFGVDVFWVHLFFMPVLWGIFVPLIAFLIARTLKFDDKVAALSGFLASSFPLLVFSGSVSVPSSLGYVFFLGTLLFCLRYLVSGKSAALCLTVVLAFASFVSHFLTGILAVGFLVLALAFKRYEQERDSSPLGSKFVLVVSFVIAVSLLPLALRYLQLVSPLRVDFSLDNLQGLSVTEIVGLFLFGEYIDYSFLYALINLAGPLLGLVGILYALYVSRKRDSVLGGRVVVLFFLFGFLVTFVDYRILKMFMVNVPFSSRRLWVLRDLTVLPFAAFVICGVVESVRHNVSRVDAKFSGLSLRRLLSGGLNVLILILLAGWTVASVFSAYPQFSPLQVTSYELEAVQHLEAVSSRNYVVIGDQYIDLAGGMFVGVNNPRAFYFSYTDSFGLGLFNDMRANPKMDVMVRALDYANCSVAYFVVDEPRLGESEFDRVVSLAVQNGLEALPTSFGGGRLVVFRYERSE